MSCFCGLTTTGKVYTVYFKGSIDGECIVMALRHIRRYLKGPVTLIWDRLSAHRSPAFKHYLSRDRRLVVEQLPAYSPDLNPEEFCHGYVKERLPNSTPKNEDGLLRLAEDRERQVGTSAFGMLSNCRRITNEALLLSL